MKREKKLQIKLWISSVLGSLLIFLIIKQFWNDVNYGLLLFLLIVGFVVNFFISITRSRNKS